MLPAPVNCLAVIFGNQKTSVPGLGAQICRLHFSALFWLQPAIGFFACP
jgi:hypothetical protein